MTPISDSLEEWWHKEDELDDEIGLLLLQECDRYRASVHQTGSDRPVCEEPKTPFPYGQCGWDCIDDMSGKPLNNTLVENAIAEEISVIRELGVWEVVDLLANGRRPMGAEMCITFVATGRCGSASAVVHCARNPGCHWASWQLTLPM